MRARIAVAVLVAALAVGLTDAALAARTASEVGIVDAKGDVGTGALDVVGVRFGSGSDDRLRAIVTMAAPWQSQALLASGSRAPGSVCLRLYGTNDPAAAPPEHLVCATVAADGSALRGEVLREHAHALPTVVGAATVTRPTQRSITIRFADSSVGTPKSLHLAVEVTMPGCSRAACTDSVPDAPKTARYPASQDAKD